MICSCSPEYCRITGTANVIAASATNANSSVYTSRWGSETAPRRSVDPATVAMRSACHGRGAVVGGTAHALVRRRSRFVMAMTASTRNANVVSKKPNQPNALM